MKISDMYLTTIKVLQLYDKEHPGKTFKLDEGTTTVKDLIAGHKKLLGWLYKDLTTECIQKVTRCYDCRYYKKYKKKGAAKGVPFYACSIDKNKRRPDFFCKDGEPREPTRTTQE